MNGSDYSMNCNMEIPSVDNILEKIHLSSTIFNEFASTYYDNKNYGFGILFKHYTENSSNNINQRASIQ